MKIKFLPCPRITTLNEYISKKEKNQKGYTYKSIYK